MPVVAKNSSYQSPKRQTYSEYTRESTKTMKDRTPSLKYHSSTPQLISYEDYVND